MPGRFAFPFPVLLRKVTIKRGLGDFGEAWGGGGLWCVSGYQKLPSTALKVCFSVQVFQTLNLATRISTRRESDVQQQFARRGRKEGGRRGEKKKKKGVEEIEQRKMVDPIQQRSAAQHWV